MTSTITGARDLRQPLRRRARRPVQTILAAALVLVAGGGLTACAGVQPRGEVTSPDPSLLVAATSSPIASTRASVAPTATPSLGPAETATPTSDPAPTATPSAELAPGFTRTSSPEAGDLTSGEAAVLLRDGRVLLMGGCEAAPQVYDPVTETFTSTGSPTEPRSGATATLLPDGRVLVAGGHDCAASEDGVSASAEIYDPATGSFEATDAMKDARMLHTATLLEDGRVLVTGGYSNSPTTATGAVVLASVRTAETSSSVLETAELFDPATDTFRPTGSMTTFRDHHTATLLSDGKVLITGGGGEGYASKESAELFDPAAGEFRATGAMREGRWLHTASLLADGRVLILGGRSPRDSTYKTAELYDPASGTFSSAGSMRDARQEHTTTVLRDGRAFIAGGTWSEGLKLEVLSATEMFDPSVGTFTSVGSMGDARFEHTATLLDDGRVLIAGGTEISAIGSSPVGSAVMYEP